MVVVPKWPAHFSAYGMLGADLKHNYAQTWVRGFIEADPYEIEAGFLKLEDQGRIQLQEERTSEKNISFERFLDMRYVGQEHFVTVPIGYEKFDNSQKTTIRSKLDKLHKIRYGVSFPDSDVEIVNLRILATGTVRKPSIAKLKVGNSVPPTESFRGVRNVFLESVDPEECNIYIREDLLAGNVIVGPAIIEEYASTTVLYSGDVATIGEYGEMAVKVGAKNSE